MYKRVYVASGTGKINYTNNSNGRESKNEIGGERTLTVYTRTSRLYGTWQRILYKMIYENDDVDHVTLPVLCTQYIYQFTVLFEWVGESLELVLNVLKMFVHEEVSAL